MTTKRGGKTAVRSAIEAAEVGQAKPSKLVKLPDFITGRFEMKPTGLWRVNRKDAKGDEKPDTWIAAPFEVLSETRDDEGDARGLWLAWYDREGGRHEMALPFMLLTGDGYDARSRLADGGLRLSSYTDAKQALLEYLGACVPTTFARCVPNVGWHHIQGARVFVLPTRTFGLAPERVIFQPAQRLRRAFASGGTLAQWRDNVAARCAGNTRMVLAVCVAFAGPLLEPCGSDGGGFNLRGSAQSGKSTVLRVGASVWGGTPGRGARGFVRSWRTTDNAMEAIAAAHSDAHLALDEMGEANPAELGKMAYMLANGEGKTRLRRDGPARPTVKFRSMFLSTGELGLADMVAQAGERTKAGQEVRLVDVPADAGAGMGIFERLHDATSANGFAELLSHAVTQFYGTAAPAFLEHIVGELARDPDGAPARWQARLGVLSRAFLLPFGEVSGQVHSVARRFALAAVAGEIATAAGITGWEAALPADAARICLEAWLTERGSINSRESTQAVAQLRNFIMLNKDVGFLPWCDPDPDLYQPESVEPGQPRFRPTKSWGWRKWVPQSGGMHRYVYYLNSSAMAEALKGLNPLDAKLVLQERGFLKSRDKAGKFAHKFSPPGGAARLYEVQGTIFEAEDDAG